MCFKSQLPFLQSHGGTICLFGNRAPTSLADTFILVSLGGKSIAIVSFSWWKLFITYLGTLPASPQPHRLNLHLTVVCHPSIAWQDLSCFRGLSRVHTRPSAFNLTHLPAIAWHINWSLHLGHQAPAIPAFAWRQATATPAAGGPLS